MRFRTITSPHILQDTSVGQVMRRVLYAMLPGIAALLWFFGWGVLLNLLLATVVALAVEALLLLARGKPLALYLGDYSAVVTAFVLISLLSWGVLKLAEPVCKLLGASGIDAMTRIMGFLLICMGAQFCINGIKEVAQDPVFHGAHPATESRAMRELPELKNLESKLAPAATH